MSVHNDDGSSLHPLAFVSPNSKAYVNELHSRIQFQHDAKDLATFIINPSMANLRNSSNGERPIHIAARVGHLSALRLLYRRGANLNATCFMGNTALHLSISNNNYWCSRFLISRGVSKEYLNNIGIPAWAGADGTCLFPSYLKALQTATTNKMVAVALELLLKTPDRVNLDEYLQTIENHKIHFPHLWRKKTKKQSRRVKKLIKRCTMIEKRRLNLDEAQIDKDEITAESVFEKIRNSMNDKLEKIIHVFRRFDTDNSGEIDRKELLYGLRDLNVRLNGEQIKLFIETIDPNNDGSIAFFELKQALKKKSKDDEDKEGKNKKRKNSSYEKLPPIIITNNNDKTSPLSSTTKKKKHLKKKNSPKNNNKASERKQHQYRTVILHEDIGGPVPIKFDDGAEKTSPYFDDDAWNNTLPGIGIKSTTP